QDLPVLWGRREQKLIRGRTRPDPAGRVNREQVYGERIRPRVLWERSILPADAELLCNVRRQDAPEVLGLGLELAVLDGPLLERPDARDAVVRLPENALPQQANRDKQQRCADEGDQQLRPDVGRQARDAPDERVTDPSPPLPGDPRVPFLGQDLRLPRR